MKRAIRAHNASVPGPGSWSRRRAAILLSAALLALAAGRFAGDAPAAEGGDALEHRVKAAFLYKFAGYVEWPPALLAQADTPVTIAVMGAEPIAVELSQMVVGRTVNGRSLTVRRVRPGDSLAGVHVLFVGKTENARLPQLAQSAQPRSILTVSESDGALTRGSIINFVLADGRVRFEIARDTAEKSGLKLSSRLLAVAQQVRTGAQ